MTDRVPPVPPASGVGRVLMLGMGWSRPAGLDRYLTDLHAALRRAGVDAHAIVFGPLAGRPASVTVAGDERRPLPLRLMTYWRHVRRLVGDADVVDGHFALYAFLPVVLGTLGGKPLVVHFQGPWADETAATRNTPRVVVVAKRGVERVVYRRAREIIVLSAAFRQLLVERYDVRPWQVHVVPPGVDLERFRPGPRAESRRRLGVDDRLWVVLAVRRLIPRMGIDVLLEAWASLAPEETDGLLLLAGDGPERARLQERAKQLGVERTVRFLGAVSDDDLPDCYRAVDLCVVPSSSLEGFGLVVLEALACGTPTIVSDAGGLPEAVHGLKARLVVKRNDASALAVALRGARDDPASLPSTERCREHAERHSWEAVAARTASVYRRAAAGSHRQRLRVVYLDHCAQLSGGEIALLRLLPVLDVESHVILSEDGDLVPLLTRAGISVEVRRMDERARGVHRAELRLRKPPVSAALFSLAYVGRLASHLRRLGPDLVHTNSLKATLYGGLAARLAGIPVVCHVRDRIAEDYLTAAAVPLVRAVTTRTAAAVIANSQATLDTLRLRSDRRPIPKVVVHDPIPPLAVEAPRPDANPFRAGIVGRIAPWKGQHVFLEAFAEAFPAGDERALVVGAPLFGEADYERALHDLVETLGLSGRVEFTGEVRDVPSQLRRIDVLVHASVVPEPFGMVVVEGMAAGLAVVAAGAGGPSEVVTHGIDGLLYPPGDVQALVSLLTRLAGDRELRRRLGSAARVKAADFAPERAAAAVMEVYRELVPLGIPLGVPPSPQRTP